MLLLLYSFMVTLTSVVYTINQSAQWNGWILVWKWVLELRRGNVLQIKYESQCNKISLNPILILSFSFTSLHCIIATISIFARLSNIYIALSAICSIDKVLLQ